MSCPYILDDEWTWMHPFPVTLLALYVRHSEWLGWGAGFAGSEQWKLRLRRLDSLFLTSPDSERSGGPRHTWRSASLFLNGRQYLKLWPPPPMARTEGQKQGLRDAAARVVAERAGLLPALALADDEIMGTDTSVSYKKGGVNPGDVYMAVIDKQSGDGFVQISREGHIGPYVKVGQNESGYETVKIERGEICMVYFSCAVFYIVRA